MTISFTPKAHVLFSHSIKQRNNIESVAYTLDDILNVYISLGNVSSIECILVAELDMLSWCNKLKNTL